MKKTANITILGGGPAGLAVGYYARKNSLDFTIYEANNHIGGNCITFRHGDFLFDSGAHRLHDKDVEITEEIKSLWQSIRTALNNGILREGASVNWYRKPDGSKGQAQHELKVYGQTGQQCQTCNQAAIEKIIVGQRGTHFCPNCQREDNYAR